MTTPDVIVIGAGVSGLTTAVHLAESGRSVRVIAKRPPLETTSANAGAVWGPYIIEDSRVVAWSKRTRLELERVAERLGADTGIRLVRGLETDVSDIDPPDWAVEVSDFELCRPPQLPAGYATGWHYTIPIVDMYRYLPYLTDRLAACGVHVEIASISSFAEVADQARIVVNCTGLESRELIPDPEMFPTRGQLVVMRNNGVNWFFQDNTHTDVPTYFLPHGDHVVLGGSAVANDSDIEPDADTAAAIIKRCGAIEPLLLEAERLPDRVGLRPTRSTVRMERVDLDGIPVIHNYGHGGSGVTLSWGCAEEVAHLLD